MRLHVILGLIDTPAGKKIEYQVRITPTKLALAIHCIKPLQASQTAMVWHWRHRKALNLRCLEPFHVLLNFLV